MSSPFVELVTCVCAELDKQGIAYALTGSVVSSVFGEPFSSQDVDICVNMTVDQARRLAAALPARFYRSDDALVAAATRRTMSNLVDMTTQFKVDLSVIPDEPYFVNVMARRQRVRLDPAAGEVWAVSPEDIVLMKLMWRMASRSSKQWENALSVVRVQREKLDYHYMDQWARITGVSDDLALLLAETKR